MNIMNDNSYDLMINEIGYENCISTKNIKFSKKKWHLFHYIIKGEGVFTLNNKSYELKKGDIFYIPIGAEPNYFPNLNNSWSYVWIGFSGLFSNKILLSSSLTYESPIYHDYDMELIDDFKEISSEYYEFHKVTPVIYGDFYRILGKIENKRLKKSKKISMKEANVYQAKEFIRNNYQFNITVNDIANNLGLSPNYLANIFKEIEGVSPKHILIEIRMNKALELIKENKIKIKDIASLTGYKNQLHFSNEFKKYYGVSPKNYKEENK